MAPGAGSPVYRWVVGLMVVTVVIAASVLDLGAGDGFPDHRIQQGCWSGYPR